MTTTHDDTDHTDIGPATPAPAWCLPNKEPQWDRLTDEYGGGMVCTWSRDMSDDVWIQCEDRIIDGRVVRSQPRIVYCEPPADGVLPAAAKEIARALIAAANVLTDADEATR